MQDLISALELAKIKIKFSKNKSKIRKTNKRKNPIKTNKSNFKNARKKNRLPR